MSEGNGAKKIPLAVLTQLQNAELRVQNARLAFDLLCAKVEQTFGVRLQGAQIADDGTVTEPQPEAPK